MMPILLNYVIKSQTAEWDGRFQLREPRYTTAEDVPTFGKVPPSLGRADGRGPHTDCRGRLR
jgi:hypothetical protein